MSTIDKDRLWAETEKQFDAAARSRGWISGRLLSHFFGDGDMEFRAYAADAEHAWDMTVGRHIVIETAMRFADREIPDAIAGLLMAKEARDAGRRYVADPPWEERAARQIVKLATHGMPRAPDRPRPVVAAMPWPAEYKP